jgi:signal transduction histidine kinase
VVTPDRAQAVRPGVARIWYWLYGGLLALVVAISVGRIGLGVVALVAGRWSGYRMLASSSVWWTWGHGLILAARSGEPKPQAVFDYAFSLAELGLALVVLLRRPRSWSLRLLGLALVAAAGTGNISIRAAATSVQDMAGLPTVVTGETVLQAIAFTAFLLALLVFPAAGQEWRRPATPRRLLITTAGALAVSGLIGVVVSPTVGSIVVFGVGVPIAGVVLIRRRRHDNLNAQERSQLRLLFSALMAATAIVTLLTLVSALLWGTGWTGLLLADPTVPIHEPEPLRQSTLLFWFARGVLPVLTLGILTASRRDGLLTAERRFSRGLVIALVAAELGGVFVVVHTVIVQLYGGDARGITVLITLATAVPTALALYPAYLRVERWVDHLLYGARPAPYSVLAGISAQSALGPADAPNLSRVAEAVGRGLDARICRLSVYRPGLGERVYEWSGPGRHDSDALVGVPIRLTGEQVGSLTVDAAAVAGLDGHRQHLLEDIADSLGVVLHASRLGIELERQLRTVRAHAEDIAASRRRLVAEMDAERRRIERDLHDGAQHHLVSLRLVLGLVEHQVATAQIERARASLTQMLEQLDIAESTLARTVAGASDSALARLGLLRALREELRTGEPLVLLDTEGIDATTRFPPGVGAAVWFCCLEAVNNARKHAPGATIRVTLRLHDDRLHFTVGDDGPGWDTNRIGRSPGRGLRNMISRVSAAGGRLSFHSAPGEGSLMEGMIPVAAPAEADRPSALPPVVGPVTLAAEVSELLSDAADCYTDQPGAAQVGALRDRLAQPLRLSVVGAPEAGTSTLVDAITKLRRARVTAGGQPPTSALVILDSSASVPHSADDSAATGGPQTVSTESADVFAVVVDSRANSRAGAGAELAPALPDGANPYPRTRAIGVLTHTRADPPADEFAGPDDPEPGEPQTQTQNQTQAQTEAFVHGIADLAAVCRVIVPVDGPLALAALTVDETRYRAVVRAAQAAGPAASSRIGTARIGTARPVPVDQPTVPLAVVMAKPGADLMIDPGDEVVGVGDTLSDWLDGAGGRLAVDLVRTGRASTAAALAQALLLGSGLPRLMDAIEAHFVRRSTTLKAWSVLTALAGLVSAEPPGAGAGPLLLRLDRIRSGAHELREIDTIDALRSGEYDLAPEPRDSAARLLGESGPEPHQRVGLDSTAAAAEVTAAAIQALTSWRRRASHPASPPTVRTVAAAVIQSCERMLQALASSEASGSSASAGSPAGHPLQRSAVPDPAASAVP